MSVNEINKIDADGPMVEDGGSESYHTDQEKKTLLYDWNLRINPQIHTPQIQFLATPDNLYG